MKKIVIILLSLVLVFALGSVIYAKTNDGGQGTTNFGQMLPMMKQAHPNFTEQQLKDLYNECHDTNGAAPSKNFKMMEHMRGS